MKTLVTTVAPIEEVKLFPQLCSHKNTAEIAIFTGEHGGVWLTGDRIGTYFTTTSTVQSSGNWEFLPVGASVTLIQE